MVRKVGLEFTLNEMLVLILLREREMYGMEIVKAAAARTSASQASIGTVYPLLKDMVRQGWLESRRTSGKPRVYYSLTERGKAQIPLVTAQWGQVNDSVSALLSDTTAERPAPRH
jgi:PadR family transcriptional regulator PadR